MGKAPSARKQIWPFCRHSEDKDLLFDAPLFEHSYPALLEM